MERAVGESDQIDPTLLIDSQSTKWGFQNQIFQYIEILGLKSMEPVSRGMIFLTGTAGRIADTGDLKCGTYFPLGMDIIISSKLAASI